MAKSALFTVRKKMSPAHNAGLNWLFVPGNTVRFSVVHTIQNAITSVR